MTSLSYMMKDLMVYGTPTLNRSVFLRSVSSSYQAAHARLAYTGFANRNSLDNYICAHTCTPGYFESHIDIGNANPHLRTLGTFIREHVNKHQKYKTSDL